MDSSLLRICSISLALTVLQGCVLHPRYEPPCQPIPDHWRFGEDDEPVNTNLFWWRQFEDPVLEALIEEALEYNRDIKVAICRVAEFYARLGIARSQLFPQIYANASASKQEATLAGVDAIPTTQDTLSGVPVETAPVPTIKRITDLFNLNATLTYELDIWGKIQSSTEAARAELFASESSRRNVVLTIVTSVATGYVQLRALDYELIIAKETQKSYEESYRLAKLRFEEGFTSELEVKQAESQIALAAVRIVRAELAISQQENLISILVGHPPTSIPRGLSIDDWPRPFSVPAGLPSDLLFQRPDLMEAEFRLIAANARIGVARADYFPSFSLTGLFGFESLELKNLVTPHTRTWQYGLNILQPLFTGGLITSNVAAAKAIKCEALYAYESTVLTAFKEVEDALVAHRQSKALHEVQHERVAILKDYLQLATLQYDNGQTDYLSVLDAERNLFDAELDLAQTQGDIFLTLVGIYKALGGGWVNIADCQVTTLSQ